MVGGGPFGWEPGEWTDDTAMAIAIAEVAATGADLRDEEALDAIVRRWGEWMHDAKDVGIQTSSVLLRAERSGQGNGRVYQLSFTATDSHNASCSAAVKVIVPHSAKPGTATDDGQKYDSTKK